MSARPHGNARYHLDGCRCRVCTDAANAYARHRTRQIAYGRWQPYVDAEPARQHVIALRAAGMGPKRIAEVSGVPHGSLAKLIYGDKARGLGPSKRIRPETEARILAVTPDPYPGGIVDGVGTRRRLRALVALGYTQSELARRIDCSRANFTKLLLAHPSKGVHEATRAAVARVYDELSMVLPPSTTPRERWAADRSRAIAQRHGWLPPLGLDDDRLDDPEYRTNRGAAKSWPCAGCGTATTSTKGYCRPCWRERKIA